MTETKVNSSLSSKFEETKVNIVQKLPDITGLTLGEFHIDSRLEIVSGEADIYLCSVVGSHSGKKFLLKYYRRENAVKPDVLEKLKTVTSPFVAPVEDVGAYQGYQYVVRPYYRRAALAELLAKGTRFSEEDLKTLIIPSIIKGLKAVHDIGILHKDLKPANLIPDDAGEHIVLIDFGISSDAGKNTFVVTQTGMTLAYAAPEALQGIFHKETDYYALGITVFELFAGFTSFQNPGLSPEEAARLASISKIEFPENFPEDLKKLVSGLTYKDISHRNEKDNPNRRWGFDEVMRWLNGEDVPEPGKGGDASSPFQPYRFNGKNYTAEIELLRAMLERPEEGLKDLGRGILSHHYYGMDEKKGDLISSAEKKLGTDAGANRRLIASLIWSLRPDYREIAFNGRVCANIQELGRAFIDAGTKEALQNHGLRGKNYPLTSAVKEFVLSGIPEDYATAILKNTAVKDLFSKTAALWINDEHTESDTELTLVLGYSLCEDRRIPAGEKIYESPEALRKEMAALVGKDRSAYLKFMETAKDDLEFLEKNIPDQESREALSRALDDVRLAVFGNNEYHFKNGQEFRSFIQKLLTEEKPYEIRSLLNRYKTPLEQISDNVWSTDALGNLQKTVAGFIQIGEYLFTGEKAFRDFITEILERGKQDPSYLLSFVKAHRNSLDSAACAFPGIKKNVAALYASRDAVIVFDEEIFSDIEAFKAFVTETLNRGRNDPGYLLEFLKRHQNAIDVLLKNPEYRTALKPLTDAAKSLIVLGSRIFTTVPALEAYLNEVIAAGRQDPGYLCRFINNHGRELSDLRRDSRCQSILNALYDIRNQMVAFDELVFGTPDEFRGFMEQILNIGKENPAYLRRFVREHEKTLTALNNVSVLAPVVAPVIAAGNSVIELDEYVFSDASGLTGFARELAGENKEKPLRGADFVREHKAGLEALKSTEALAPAIKDFQALAHAREKGAGITVNGTRYSQVTIKKGEFLKFGNYLQNNGYSKEPIEWLVLEVNDQETLLVSRYGLNCRRYHQENVSTTWEQCDLRKWLNHEFLKTAFSEEEQQRIKFSEVENDDNRQHGTRGGNDTRDRVFCLSLAEVERYFKNDSERRCQPTVRAKVQGAYVSNGYCVWWLRSPGGTQEHASNVGSGGVVLPYGNRVGSIDDAVRPALRLIWDFNSADPAVQMSQVLENTGEKAETIMVNGTRSAPVLFDTKSVKKGGYIKFGNYPQQNGNAKGPIEWLVLEVMGDKALLVSRYGLDCKQYHHDFTDITWENCFLRKWLNNVFLKAAFSAEEQQRIRLSEVANDDNPEYRTRGGNNTQDRVFCLSLAEAKRYFKDNRERMCRPTVLAKAHGVYVSDHCCYWWLRSPGGNQYDASLVDTDGALDPYGYYVRRDNYAVRPALWLIWDLNSADPAVQMSQVLENTGEKVETIMVNGTRSAPVLFDTKSVKKGGYIKFGNYQQQNGNAKGPIEWLVLEVRGDEALLVSRYGLDCKQYHHKCTDITWENCFLRKWLNGEFLKAAFSEDEQQRIKLSDVANFDNPKYRTRGGFHTRDWVFCLSPAEAERYFKDNSERMCRPAAQAKVHGASVSDDGHCWWWLRSPGYDRYRASRVGTDGALDPYGGAVYIDDVAVRPALRLILNR